VAAVPLRVCTIAGEGDFMSAWLMGIGLTLTIGGLALAAPDALETTLTLVTPDGFCVADGSHPMDAKATAIFKKSFESQFGGKLLSLYRFCPGSATTAGFIVVADLGAFKGSASSFVGGTCTQFKALKEVAPPDMDRIIAKTDKIAREELGRGTVVRGLKVLSAVLEREICYAFVQPEGSLRRPAMEILSYVPIRNKVIIVARAYNVTAQSDTGESYRHLQQTIAALQQANP
jgi:hypothetical protein